MVLVGIMGYRKYTSAIASFSLGQISEFSFILATLGVSLGHIPEEVMGLITLVGLITMGLSTYAILYSHHLYEWLSPSLSWFEAILPHPKKQLGDLAEASRRQVGTVKVEKESYLSQARCKLKLSNSSLFVKKISRFLVDGMGLSLRFLIAGFWAFKRYADRESYCLQTDRAVSAVAS